MTYYQILQISESASIDIIKSAYKTLMKKYHPDVYNGDLEEAKRKSQQINEAYEVLSDNKKRICYDEELKLRRQEEKTYEFNQSKDSNNTQSNIKYKLFKHKKYSAGFIYFFIFIICISVPTCIERYNATVIEKGTIEKDGAIYSGQYLRKSKLPQGYGTKEYEKDGRSYKYTGYWKSGKPFGEGTMLMIDEKKGKITFNGNWEGWNTGKNIKCKAEFILGDVFEIVYESYDDDKTGKGTITYIDDSIYAGDIKDFIREGKGTLIWDDGTYTGYWKNDAPNGKGRFEYGNGNIYYGDVINWSKCGNGTMKCTNGISYSGEWNNNLPNGEGTCFVGENSYSGVWKDGKSDCCDIYWKK